MRFRADWQLLGRLDVGFDNECKRRFSFARLDLS
jgi:hypothetical protein